MYQSASYNHYPNQYPSAPPPLPYFPQYQPPSLLKQIPAETLSQDPSEPAVTQEVASQAIQRLVSLELQNVGFDNAVSPAVQRLELEVATFVQQLFQRAHEYANLANRASAIATDVLHACEDFNMRPGELHQVSKALYKKKSGNDGAPPKSVSLTSPPSRSPSPALLSSDDEDAPSTVPATLRNLPAYFPDLPPKHTYLQTPASPPKKAALPSLEKKLKTAALVQESLQHLLLSTEDTMNQEDGELLGHIVNWEMNTQPRKRWRVQSK